MKRFVCLLALAITAVCALTAAAEDYRLSASDDRLWLARTETKSGRFDLLTRTDEDKWTWVVSDSPGRVKALAAERDTAHVFFSGGHYWLYTAEALIDTGRVGRSLPPGSEQPLAVTAPAISGPWASEAILAVVAEPIEPAEPQTQATQPATESTTQPTTEPTSIDLVVLSNEVGQWDELTRLGPLPAGGEVFMAPFDGRLYLAVDGSDGFLLAWWNGESWTKIPTTDWFEPADDVIDLFPFQEKLAFVVASPAEAEDQQQLHLAIWPGDGVPARQPVRGAEGAMQLWPADAQLQFAARADDIHVLWEADGEPMLARLGADGQLAGEPAPVTTLSQPPAEQRGKEIISNFVGVVLIMAFVLMFMLRPRTLPKRFELPPAAVCGGLVKRGLAAFIDLLPFFVLSVIVVQPDVPTGSFDRYQWAQEFQGSNQAAYMIIAWYSSFIVYCFLMEWKFGATVGKMLFKLRVVGDEARPADARQVALRNLTKAIELTVPLVLLPILLLPLFITRYRQRLGDLVARTSILDVSEGMPEPGPATPPDLSEPPYPPM